MKNNSKLRILIADDHRIVRDGLRMILEKEQDMEVVAESDNGLETVELAKSLSPDLVVVDILMPGMNGIETTQKLLHEIPEIAILVLSMCEEKQFVIEALNSGAKGYLLKDCVATDLVIAIRNIITGGIPLSQKVTELIVKEYIQPTTSKNNRSDDLSVRQVEILRLIAEGKNTKEIAFLLNVSKKTVENHRHNIMKKLGINSIAELVIYAIRKGIISVSKSSKN